MSDEPVEPQAATIPVRVQLVFMAGQQPMAQTSFDVPLALPTEEGEMAQLAIQIDVAGIAAEFAKMQQPQPQRRPSGILVPGAPRLPAGNLKLDD